MEDRIVLPVEKIGGISSTNGSSQIGEDEGAERNLRDWFVRGDLCCLNCQYSMRGLVGPVVVICPECGEQNDLRDPNPWRRTELPLGVRQREH